MATAIPTKATNSDLSAIADFPALAQALIAAVEICEQLEEAGYQSASALSCALTGGACLPELAELADYVEQVTEQARLAQLCGWDLGANRWWSHRVEYEETIDHIRAELSTEPEHLAAFESFNGEFETAYPALAQALSIAVDRIHNPYSEEAGTEALRELQPDLEAVVGKLVADRQLARI